MSLSRCLREWGCGLSFPLSESPDAEAGCTKYTAKFGTAGNTNTVLISEKKSELSYQIFIM